MARYIITSKGEAIGEVEFMFKDFSVGVATGIFYPFASFETVRSLFRTHLQHDGTFGEINPDKLRLVEDEIQKLNLRLLYADEKPFHPSSFYLVDLRDELNEPVELSAIGLPQDEMLDLIT